MVPNTTTSTPTPRQIFVKTATHTVTIDLPSNTPGPHSALPLLQHLIFSKTGIPAAEQALSFRSRPVCCQTAASLPPHATLTLGLRVCGGGVQGLMSLLESEAAHASPRLIHFAAGGVALNQRNAVLVDAGALKSSLQLVLDGSRSLCSAERCQRMYHNTRIFCAALRARGITLHIAIDGAAESGSEKTVFARQVASYQRGSASSGTGNAFRRAILDELPADQIHQARAGADSLVYALACKLDDEGRLLGVFTTDTDFLIYGRHNILFAHELPLHDILSTGRLDHIYLWSPAQVWNLLAGRDVDTTIRQRAIFAVLLGNDAFKDARVFMGNKGLSPKRTARAIFDPASAASAIPVGNPLNSQLWLRQWTLWFKDLLPACAWRDEHTVRFYTAVLAYITTVEAGAAAIPDLVYTHDDAVLSPGQQRFLDRVPAVAMQIVPVLARGQVGGRPSKLEAALLAAHSQHLLPMRKLFIHVPAHRKVLVVGGHQPDQPPPPPHWLTEEAYTEGPDGVECEALDDPADLLPPAIWELLNGELPSPAALMHSLLALLDDDDDDDDDDSFLTERDDTNQRAALVAAMVFFLRMREVEANGGDGDAVIAEADALIFVPDDRPHPALQPEQHAQGEARVLSFGRLTPQDWDVVDDPEAKRRVQSTQTFKLLQKMCGGGGADAMGAAYPHQREYLEHLAERLPADGDEDEDGDEEAGPASLPISEDADSGDELGHAGEAADNHPRPLQLLFSTPTGSGKTFSALLGFMHLIQQRRRKIMIYCTPNMAVLQNIGLLCEAHDLVYWIATTVGVDVYNVLRPFSIRRDASSFHDAQAKSKSSSRGKQGCMYRMLYAACAAGEYMADRGGGRPQVIVADVEAGKALLDSHYYDPSDLVFFFDEPDACDPELFHKVVKHTNGPQVLVLASATLPSCWDEASDELRQARAGEVDKAEIYTPPFELPPCQLAFVDAGSRSLQRPSLLHLFSNPADMDAHLSGLSDHDKALLLRFLCASEQRGPALFGRLAHVDAEDFEGWRRDGQLGALRFNHHAVQQSLAAVCEVSGGGVTLLAARDVRVGAEFLLGLSAAQLKEEAQRIRKEVGVRVKEKRRLAARAQAMHEADESQLRQERGGGGGGAAPDEGTSISLGNLELTATTAEELMDADDVEVVCAKHRILLSATNVTAAMRNAFAQVALHTPEEVLKKRRFAGTVLVVDADGIYGLDCRGINHVVLHESLESTMTANQLVQFLGRLRGAGTATFSSWAALNRAILHRAERTQAPLLAVPQSFVECVREQIDAHMGRLSDAFKADRASGAWQDGQFQTVGGTLLRLLREHPEYSLEAALKLLFADVLAAAASDGRGVVLLKFLEMLQIVAEKRKEWTDKLELGLLKQIKAQIKSGVWGDQQHAVITKLLNSMYNADLLSSEVFEQWFKRQSKADFFPDMEVYGALEDFYNDDGEEEEE